MRDMKFYGSVTLGERGQIVIPAEAREALKLEKGEKLLCLGMNKEMLVLQKVSALKSLSEMLEKKRQEIEDIMEKID
jgi:AbrB family looped-hinge helix DNA binding protein